MLALLIENTLIYATVLTLVALGGMFSERSGVINIGLEGIMVMGALGGAIGLSVLHGVVPAWLLVILVVLISMLTGLIFSLLLAFATITFKADQTITGTALNILSVSLAVILARVYNGTPSAEIEYNKMDFLFKIGSININIMTILCIIAVVASFVALYKHKFGMRLMSCGEHPQAADTVGVNVNKMRYIGVMISGALGGLGGIAYIFPGISTWNFQNGVSGFGFLALAVMIFGQWKPIRIVLAALLFGFFRALSINYGSIEFLKDMPGIIFSILPYVVSLIVLALTAKTSRAPKAAGIPYDKGLR